MKYKKIGIICAMEMEAAKLIGEVEKAREVRVGAFSFWEGTIGEREVVIAVCGIGKVFAALCAQSMILHFSPDAIFNSGVAGSLTDKLDILHIAISDDLVQHDMDTSPLGDPVGLISGINKVFLPSSSLLAEAVEKICGEMKIPCLRGTIASGDQFIASAEQKEKIIENFRPIACEMEGAAIAQAAFVSGIPFCAIRAISDSFSGKNEMDYALFAPQAAEKGAALLLAILKDQNIL